MGRKTQITNIISLKGLLVAKSKFHALCDTEGNNVIDVNLRMFRNIIPQGLSVTWILPDDDRSTHARTPHAVCKQKKW